ncbi:MAG: sulfur oxidation c-type cytochrome SoxA [Chromatiales bacterium]|jgi:sulfur-oxidizing protein SoxA
MRKYISALLAASVTIATGSVMADNNADAKSLSDYFVKKFPGVATSDLINGSYALDESLKSQWENIEEFPPYEDFVSQGEEIWNKKFANGKSFASCFGSDPSKVRVKYPHWDSASSKVVTLEGDINKCLTDNGEKPMKWGKGPIAYLSSYLGYKARGQKINVVVPNDPKAKAAYEDGKQFFYAKRGQLNLSCADCHVYYAGSFVRADLLSPATGHVTHFPVYRQKWSANPKNDGLGTLHRRYGGCNKQVRAKPFKAQGDEYRNLEFFHASMSNGLEINAPGYRK